MQAILVHGMGRTPLSQLILAKRLRDQGFEVHLFGYSSRRPFDSCVTRLVSRVRAVVEDQPFILVGHSLGTVLIRAALPRLTPLEPVGCFFLAPPSRVPRAAKFFAGNPIYRLYSHEMGQLLASDEFMNSLPMPTVPVRVYAGTGGPTGRRSPFGSEENDGILAVSETPLEPGGPVVRVPVIHTVIMNSQIVADDIAAMANKLGGARRHP
ncbi:MAG: alpha/beta hydrolase [Acidobacteriota bacterium]